MWLACTSRSPKLPQLAEEEKVESVVMDDGVMGGGDMGVDGVCGHFQNLGDSRADDVPAAATSAAGAVAAWVGGAKVGDDTALLKSATEFGEARADDEVEDDENEDVDEEER